MTRLVKRTQQAMMMGEIYRTADRVLHHLATTEYVSSRQLDDAMEAIREQILESEISTLPVLELFNKCRFGGVWVL
jgi:hypothetical protein